MSSVVAIKSSKNASSQSQARHECGDHTTAQLCFACRPRAKVSWFPLADRLAERTRALADYPQMITRSRIFITTALLCHLLLARGIVTSQTLPPAATAVSTAENAQATAPVVGA